MAPTGYLAQLVEGAFSDVQASSCPAPVAIDTRVWHPAGCEWGSKEDIHEASWRCRCAEGTGCDAHLALPGRRGCVDAVGYLELGQVTVANTTGNTVLLGIAIGQADGRGVLHGDRPCRFVLGVAVGAAIVERGPERAAWTPSVTTALGLEFVILVAFAAGWLIDGSEPSRVVVYPRSSYQRSRWVSRALR